MSNSGLTPTPIVDKNGKQTTVHKKMSEGYSASRPLPASPKSTAERPININAEYVRIPDGVNPEDAHVAFNYIGSSLIGYTDDPINVFADYATVTKEGISYGIRFDNTSIGEIFAGAQNDGESDSDYDARVLSAFSDHNVDFQNFIEETYGADIGEGEDNHSLVEFYVEYEDDNPRMSSLEWMEERAANETNLLKFNNDYSYGMGLQESFAAKFGYHYQTNDSEDGFWTKGVLDDNE